MLKLENTDVVGWEAAIRGMRNPMNSWAMSDSFICEGGEHKCHDNCPYLNEEDCPANVGFDDNYIIGPNDLDLMKRLREAGTDHRKYLRMIVVYVDITAPLYWWKEFDTYKVGTVVNSCSTMHKIQAKKFTLEDFSTEHLFQDWGDLELRDSTIMPCTPMQHFQGVIACLNVCRKKYIECSKNLETLKDGFATKELQKQYWWQMIQLLPSSYNQKRTVMMNYEVLANIYKSRRNHKLDEWHVLCDWIENLPYSELITGNSNKLSQLSKDLEEGKITMNEARKRMGLPELREVGQNEQL